MYYDEIDGLEFLKPIELMEIEGMAAGLSEQEVLDYYGLDLAELEDTIDLKWFQKAFRKGRSRAKQAAVQKLFTAMSDRNGAQASIAYLRHFGDKWPQADQAGIGEGKFSFNVVMD